MDFLKIGFLPVGGKKEKETYETLKEHSKSVVECVEKFEEGITAYSEQDYEKGEELLQEVDKLESKADKKGYEFEVALRKGAFLPAFRGDLSKLSETIDDIADTAEESIREIYRRPKVFEDLAEAEKENGDAESLRLGLVELASTAVSAARTTDKAISILMEDMDEAAEIAEEIHRVEHDADAKEDEIAIALYKHEDLLSPVTIMQMRLLIDKFGDIADAAEDSGDIISAMTFSLKA